MLTLTANQAEILAAERAAHNEMRTRQNASSLPRESWIAWDDEFLGLAEQHLAVFDDLSNSVSTVVPIGAMEHGYEAMDGNWKAKETRDFTYEAQNKRTTTEEYKSPVGVFSETFEIGYREAMNVEGAAGGQLGAGNRANAMRAVVVALEDLALNGSSININGATSGGLMTHTARNQISVAVGGTGNLNAATGEKYASVFAKCLEALLNDNHGGKNVTFYVSSGDWLRAATQPYDATGGAGFTKISDYIRTMEGVAGVVASQRIPANRVLAVVKDKTVVEIPYAMPPAVRAMERLDARAPFAYAAEAVAGITIKRDRNGNCGVVDATVTS